jgi:hypothetical protein
MFPPWNQHSPLDLPGMKGRVCDSALPGLEEKIGLSSLSDRLAGPRLDEGPVACRRTELSS